MAVNSTPISPITPGQTTVGESIASANTGLARVVEQALAINTLQIDVGNKSALQTTSKTSLVSAINEILDRFNNGFLITGITGVLSNLQTSSKSNLVSAINEVNSHIGDPDVLATTARSSIVAAINELVNESSGVGSLQNLTTTDKSTIVAAINELVTGLGPISNLPNYSNVIAAVNELLNSTGNLSTLKTTAKSNLVAALNEVVTRYNTFIPRSGGVAFTGDTDFGGNQIKNVANGTAASDAATVGQIKSIVKVGNLSELSTSTKENIVLAINEVTDSVGTLNLLTTTDKTTIVDAINEIVENIDYQDMQIKLSTLSSVRFGGSITTDHSQYIDFRAAAATPSDDYDFRIIRRPGTNGIAQICNNGTGNIEIATKDDTNGVVPRVKINDDPYEPMSVWSGGLWVPVSLGGLALPLTGGIMEGAIAFDKSLSVNNLLLDLQQGYKLFSDSTGSYSGSTTRLWFDSPANGEVHFGPKGSGTLKGFEIDTERLDISGEIFSSSDITLLSDERVKTNVRTIRNALDKVENMRGVHYIKDEKESTGVIAQELRTIAPELVKETPDGMLSVNYPQLTAYLIEAVKQLRNEVNDLRSKVK